jgi:hypothetical protein
VSPAGLLAWGPHLDGVSEPTSVWEHRTLHRETAEGETERIMIASRAELSALDPGFGGFSTSVGGPPDV